MESENVVVHHRVPWNKGTLARRPMHSVGRHHPRAIWIAYVSP